MEFKSEFEYFNISRYNISNDISVSLKFAFCIMAYISTIKVSEMQNLSMIFKSNSNYIKRVAHKKLSKKNIL